MQQNIWNIIRGDGSQEEKIVSLREIFSASHDVVFSDLDDTITSYSSLLYSRVYLMKKMFPWITPEMIAQRVIPYMNFQKVFLDLVHSRNVRKIVILSRNDYPFLEILLPHLQDYFAPLGIEILAIVGRLDGKFSFSSEDKIAIIPRGTLLISDVFEKYALIAYPHFLLTEDMPFVHKKFLQFEKSLRLLFFFFSLFFRWKILSK